jgi:hypothetical protein
MPRRMRFHEFSVAGSAGMTLTLNPRVVGGYVMLNAIEELMRLHPASHFGRLEHHPSDLEAFEELESRHLRPRQADRREPTWMIGEVAAAAAILIALVGVLTLFARLAVDGLETGQQSVAAISNVAEGR